MISRFHRALFIELDHWLTIENLLITDKWMRITGEYFSRWTKVKFSQICHVRNASNSKNFLSTHINLSHSLGQGSKIWNILEYSDPKVIPNLKKGRWEYRALVSSPEKLQAYRKQNGYTEIPFQCGICLKIFPDKRRLGKHRQFDHGIRKQMKDISQKVSDSTDLIFVPDENKRRKFIARV